MHLLFDKFISSRSGGRGAGPKKTPLYITASGSKDETAYWDWLKRLEVVYNGLFGKPSWLTKSALKKGPVKKKRARFVISANQIEEIRCEDDIYQNVLYFCIKVYRL